MGQQRHSHRGAAAGASGGRDTQSAASRRVASPRTRTLKGLAVTRRARRTSPPVPVVLITGYTSTQAKQEAQAAGAIVFLPKPFSAAEFMGAVNRALGIPSA